MDGEWEFLKAGNRFGEVRRELGSVAMVCGEIRVFNGVYSKLRRTACHSKVLRLSVGGVQHCRSALSSPAQAGLALFGYVRLSWSGCASDDPVAIHSEAFWSFDVFPVRGYVRVGLMRRGGMRVP